MLEKEVKTIINNIERGSIDIKEYKNIPFYLSQSKITRAMIKRLDEVENFKSTSMLPLLGEVYENPSVYKIVIFTELQYQCYKLNKKETNLILIDYGVYSHTNYMFTFVAQFEYTPINSTKKYLITYYVAPTIEAAKVTLLPR